MSLTSRARRTKLGLSGGVISLQYSNVSTEVFQSARPVPGSLSGHLQMKQDRQVSVLLLFVLVSATTCLAGGTTASPSYACEQLLGDSLNYLQQQLDPFTGLPYDQLRCDCLHQSDKGVCLSSGVVPQLADAAITEFAQDSSKVSQAVQWSFIDATPEGDGPSLLYALELRLQLSEENQFGGLIWGASADISRYKKVRIRYRTANPSDVFEFKLNTGKDGAERAVDLPGTQGGSWTEVSLRVPEAFPGIDPRLLNFFVLASSLDKIGETSTLWVDHLAFVADPELSTSCEVTLDCAGKKSCFPDLAALEPQTGVVNIANALATLSLLPEIGPIEGTPLDTESAKRSVEAILDSLSTIPASAPSGTWMQDWHSPASLMPDPRNRIASMTDQPQLYAALMLVEETWPDLAEKSASLRGRMDFSVLYESTDSSGSACPGALHWAIDACQGVQDGNLEYYGNDSLLGIFLAIATGAAPGEFWSDCLSLKGCTLNGPASAPWFTTGLFCENPDIPATETGGPFLQLAGLLYLDGNRLDPTPISLAESARNMLAAQADFALQSQTELWGWSNSSDPDACDYMDCQELSVEKVTPYICAMGLDLLPECGSNLLSFRSVGADSPLDTGSVLHPFGLRDAWNQDTNQARDAYLYLDTGWSVLGLMNTCYEEVVRRQFMEHPIAQQGYALLANETDACACENARLTLNPRVGYDTPIYWTPSECSMVVQAYQGGELVSQAEGVSGSVTVGQLLPSKCAGNTELKIWVPGAPLPSDSLVVDVVLEQYGDDFEADRCWVLSKEEAVNPSCSLTGGEGQVTRSTDLASTGEYSLRVWANKALAAGSNHVIAGRKLANSPRDGRWLYRVEAYIPSGTADQRGQTGPEFSIQNTRRLTSGDLETTIAGIQYRPAPSEGCSWAIWTQTAEGGVDWQDFPAQCLDPDRWYTIEVEADFNSKRYVRFAIDGVNKDLWTDEVPLGSELNKPDFEEEAFWLTLESENALDACDSSDTFQYVVYYDNPELLSPQDFPTAGAGAGSSTEVNFLQGDTELLQNSGVAVFRSQNGDLLDSQSVELTPHGTSSLGFSGGEGLDIGHIELFAGQGVFASEILELAVPGFGDVPPIGVPASPSCEQPAVVLKEDSEFKTGVALSNPNGEKVTCDWSIYSGLQSPTEIASGNAMIEPFGQIQFFPLDGTGVPLPFEGKIEFDCSSADQADAKKLPVQPFSLFQRNTDFAIFSNPAFCP